MSLSELKTNQTAVITDFCGADDLKERLFSLGVSSGKKVKKINSSLGGKTIAIELERSCVILRTSEAQAIKVEII